MMWVKMVSPIKVACPVVWDVKGLPQLGQKFAAVEQRCPQSGQGRSGRGSSVLIGRARSYVDWDAGKGGVAVPRRNIVHRRIPANGPGRNARQYAPQRDRADPPVTESLP
jgi:hypothetical protein